MWSQASAMRPTSRPNQIGSRTASHNRTICWDEQIQPILSETKSGEHAIEEVVDGCGLDAFDPANPRHWRLTCCCVSLSA